MSVETEVELIPPRPYGLISDFSSIKYENKFCMYPGCNEPPIGSHVLSKSCIRKYADNQIIQLQTSVFDPFENIKPKAKRKYYNHAI